MKASEYAKRMDVIMGDNAEDCTDRKLCISFTTADYGWIDSAILELSGSPPRRTIMITGLRSNGCENLMVGGWCYKAGSKKGDALIALVHEVICDMHAELLNGGDWVPVPEFIQ